MSADIPVMLRSNLFAYVVCPTTVPWESAASSASLLPVLDRYSGGDLAQLTGSTDEPSTASGAAPFRMATCAVLLPRSRFESPHQIYS